ncbi:MAG: SLC13 family permease [Anaerolineae bacterium]
MDITIDMYITMGILILAMIFFITERLRVDVVALGVLVLLMISNVLTVNEALAGFSNSAVLLITALFIVGGAVFQTGLANVLADQIVKIAGTSETRLLVVIMIAVAVVSGFISSTGTVAVLMPAVISLAISVRINPSRLLMPLAFASLLGGATTLIGTPPNIIVSDALVEAGFEPFGFFSFAPIGFLLVAVGIALALFMQRFLPDNTPANSDEETAASAAELIETYHLGESVYRARIRSASKLAGKPISESNIGHDYELNILEVLRPPAPRKIAAIGNQEIVMQAARHNPIHPQPDTILQHNDILILQGEPDHVSRLVLDKKLAIQASHASDRHALLSEEVGVAEVVLPPTSSLIGKTLIDLRFSNLYNLKVLSIRRPGQGQIENLREEKLEFGDILLVQGSWDNIFHLSKQNRDFVLIGGTQEVKSHLYNRDKAPIALAILVGMLVVLVTGWLPTTTAAMLASLLVVLTGCLTMDEAYDAIDWKSVVLVAGMLPMSTALVNVGWIDLMGTAFAETLGAYGPIVVMAGLFLITSALTQVLSNTTTSVILAPLAIVIAQQLNVQPHAFLMSVAMAASMAFLTPVASPVNTLVMGAGNYRFTDYIKIGTPYVVVTFIMTMLALPFLFPF